MKHRFARYETQTFWPSQVNRRYAAILLAAAGCALSLATTPLGAVEIDWLGDDGAWEDSTNWPDGILPTDEDFIRLPDGVTVTSSGNANIAEELLSRAKLNVLDGLFSVVGTIDSLDDFVLFPNSAVAAGRIFMQANALFDVADDTNVDVVEGVFSSGIVDIHHRGTLNAESFDNFNLWKVRAQGTAVANSIINHDNAFIEIFDASSVFDINGNLTNNGSVAVTNAGSARIDSIDNNGTLNVTSGGELSGNSIDNYNSVAVAGNSTQWMAEIVTNYTGKITMNDSASGTVGNLDNRAILEIDNSTMTLTNGINAPGGNIKLSNNATLNVANVLTNESDITVDVDSTLATATFQQLAGTTAIDGGVMGADDLSASDIAGGTLSGHGDIRGDLTVTGSGALSPDNGIADPSGQFLISDSLNLAGTFNVDLGGTSGVDFDRLLVNASASLAGTLNVELVDGFSPVVGNFFDIIVAPSVLGDFNEIFLPMLGNGLVIDASNEGTFYRLQVTAVPIPPIVPAFMLCLLYLRRRGLRRR